jgi:hypothetical protein
MDELMTVLVNERKFYNIFAEYVKYFIEDEVSYKQFRQRVYGFMCGLFNNYTNCAAVTTVVIWRGLLHYREEFNYTGSQAHVACARMQEPWMQNVLSHWTTNKQSSEGRRLNDDVKYWIYHKDRIKHGSQPSPKSEEEKTEEEKTDLVKKIVLDSIYGKLGQSSEQTQAITAIPTPTALKENTMPINAEAPVSTVTYIYGVDAANVNDAAIFEHIRVIENDIKSLEAIKTRPVALDKRIDELYKDIEALVKFSNDRQPKAEATA